MVTPEYLRRYFHEAQRYDEYVSTGTPDQQSAWKLSRSLLCLNSAQRELVASFTRRVNVLALSGLWCGDCAQQAPMLDHIHKANDAVLDVRFIDRGRAMDLAEQVRICGGLRVPTVIFMNEDYEFLSLYGDKSLSRLRASARRALGAACAVPGALMADDETAATLQDWVDEFERAHLIARLSPRLREKHGD